MVLNVSYTEDIGTTCSSTSSSIKALNSCPADVFQTVQIMLNVILPVCYV